MARVLTNNTSLRVAIESSIGQLPGSPLWTIVEFDTIGAYGAIITTVVRRPISVDRGRKKGTVTDLDSTVEYETDLTVDAFTLFAEGFVFAEYANSEFNLRSGTGTLPPPAVAAGGVFTIDAASALLAGKMQWVAAGPQTLVFANGYTGVNNGLHVLAADVAATDTSVDVTTVLVDETPATNATLEVAGLRTDDLTLTISGSTATLVSAADVDWTTTGLQVGQFIHIGSPDSTGAVQNAYDNTGTDDVYGYARITAITTTTLSLDKLDVNLSAAGSPYAPETVDVMFGRFLRNVPVTADADDTRYLERTFQFEVAYPDLGGVGTDEYEYAIGNFVNEVTLNLPLTDKATVGFGFIGTNADDITGTRKTNAANAVSPLKTVAFNTSTDIVSITTDVISLVSDVCFKSLTITLLNNVSPEKCLGTLGAVFVNAGLFEVNIEGQLLFTNKSIINAIKNNTTVTFLAILQNQNGAIALDIPELTLGGGGREFPVDQSVLVNITGASYTSTTYGYDIGVSLFPAVAGTVAA
jgi:hypothetical protein